MPSASFSETWLIFELTMEIKITIKAGSKAHKAVEKLMADQAAFRKAVETGTIAEYMKKHGHRFATPVSLK